MDPVSAIGLASAIVAFLDFSWNLVTGTWEIYHSLDGVTAENARLEDVTGDLGSLAQALKADVPVKTKAEKNIRRLAQDCEEDANTLQKLLGEMKAPGKRRSFWKSLNAKWKSILNSDEVAQLKSQLQENRAEIQLNLIAMLREEQSAINLQITSIAQDCHALKTDQSKELERLRKGILDLLEECSESFQQLTSAQLGISRQLEELQSMITTIPIQHRILRHLVPDEIGSRRDQILEADPNTCRWILEPVEGNQGYREQIRDDFIGWLRTGSNILHISGNPGAGKSTLMKFIASNERTQKELRAWAGNRQLIFGQFYFWAAGTDAQRTFLGMLRSLLFQVLSQCPSLIEHVFANQLRKMKMSRFQSDPAVEKFQDFGSKQIQEAFDLLLTVTDNSDHRIFFLIDGLDESEGNDLKHEDLAASLKQWTVGGNIKLAVSSRPWPFLKTFTAYPTLHLHKLNSLDIRTYAIQQLEQDEEICQIGVDRMRETIEDLVEEVVYRAQGIFLWAHLVVDTIRLDVRRRYSVDLLKAKVRQYPPELDDLYDKLRKKIEDSPIDRKLSNRMLLLAAGAPKDFQLLAMAFSWLPEDDESGLLDPSFPPSTQCEPYSDQDVKERLQCVAARVNGLTRGFLELVTVETLDCRFSTQEIRFCHRTARDYLMTNVKRHAALKESWPGFPRSDPYGRIYLAELIHSRLYEDLRADVDVRIVRDYLTKPFCRDFSIDTIRKFATPMQPLLSPVWRKTEGFPFEDNSHAQTVSFLHYAAYCGLDSFVLSEIANNPGPYPHSPDTNILLASLDSHFQNRNRNFDLALNLLQNHVIKDSILEATVQVQFLGAGGLALSVWSVAIIGSLFRLVCDLDVHLSERKGEDFLNPSLLKLCRLLVEFGADLGQSLLVTVRASRLQICDRGARSIDPAERAVSAVQLLEWAEQLNSGAVNLQGSHDMAYRDLRLGSDSVLNPLRGMEDGDTDVVCENYETVSWKLDRNIVSAEGDARDGWVSYQEYSYRVF